MKRHGRKKEQRQDSRFGTGKNVRIIIAISCCRNNWHCWIESKKMRYVAKDIKRMHTVARNQTRSFTTTKTMQVSVVIFVEQTIVRKS
jgi:hypothetical protein